MFYIILNSLFLSSHFIRDQDPVHPRHRVAVVAELGADTVADRVAKVADSI